MTRRRRPTYRPFDGVVDQAALEKMLRAPARLAYQAVVHAPDGHHEHQTSTGWTGAGYHRKPAGVKRVTLFHGQRVVVAPRDVGSQVDITPVVASGPATAAVGFAGRMRRRDWELIAQYDESGVFLYLTADGLVSWGLDALARIVAGRAERAWHIRFNALEIVERGLNLGVDALDDAALDAFDKPWTRFQKLKVAALATTTHSTSENMIAAAQASADAALVAVVRQIRETARAAGLVGLTA